VLHGPFINPEIQHLAPNRTVTESHLLGVCSATDAEQNGVLLGLPPAATLLSHRGVPPHIRRASRESRLQEPLDLPPDAQPTVGFGSDLSALEYSHALKLTPPHDPVAMVFRCFAGCAGLQLQKASIDYLEVGQQEIARVSCLAARQTLNNSVNY